MDTVYVHTTYMDNNELQCRPVHIIVYFSLSQVSAYIFDKFFNVNYWRKHITWNTCSSISKNWSKSKNAVRASWWFTHLIELILSVIVIFSLSYREHCIISATISLSFNSLQVNTSLSQSNYFSEETTISSTGKWLRNRDHVSSSSTSFSLFSSIKFCNSTLFSENPHFLKQLRIVVSFM